ncbi:transposable element Tcb2 transposase [Trichonephila clavipes]|nr:transposable element Tcb2 transposase [Trichonephila clavipes]
MEGGRETVSSNIRERGGPGVLVWGGIMMNGWKELHIFSGSLLTGIQLSSHVRLFQGALDPNFTFVDDNARPHRTSAVEEFLECEDICRMDWQHASNLNHTSHM